MATIGETDGTAIPMEKTARSDLRVVASDASSLFSLKSGAVSFRVSLPKPVSSGVYRLCDRNKYFADYLLFMLNPADKFTTPPGMYAAFSPGGIQFSVWTSAGLYSIFDVTSAVPAGAEFVIEFAWDWSGRDLGAGANAAIFVNGVCSSSSNMPIAADPISGIELTMLDSSQIDFNTECRVYAFAAYDGVPSHLRMAVDSLSSKWIGREYVALLGRDALAVFPAYLSAGPVVIPGVGSPGDSRYGLASCDSSGDLYVATNDPASPDLGKVFLVDSADGSVAATMSGLDGNPVVAVGQLDGIDFPRLLGTEVRRSDRIWIGDSSRLILADHLLNVISELGGFSSISAVVPLNDGRVWVCDTGDGKVKLVSDTNSAVVAEFSIPDPKFAAATVESELFVFSGTAETIYKVLPASIAASVAVGPSVVSMDADPNSGIVILGFSFGKVRAYSRDLKPKWIRTVSGSLAVASVARGYYRDTIWTYDPVIEELAAWSIHDGTKTASSPVAGLIFCGSICGPGVNSAILRAEADVGGQVSGAMSAVHNVRVFGYKVDTLHADLTGGGENESVWRDGGPPRDSKPTDLRPGNVKSGRLPE